jgi:hypothetical protein
MTNLYYKNERQKIPHCSKTLIEKQNKYHTVWEVRKLSLKNKTNTTLSEKFENSHWKTKQIPHCLRSSKTLIEKQNKYHTVGTVPKIQ